MSMLRWISTGARRVRDVVALVGMAWAMPALADVTCKGELFVYRTFGFHGQTLAPTYPVPPCSPGTNLSWGPTGLWNPGGPAGAVAGGDSITVTAWASATIGYIQFDPTDLPVTPTSETAGGSFALSVRQLTPTRFEYTLDVNLSDPGVAGRVRWYDYDGLLAAPFNGDNTQLPDWSAASSLLGEASYSGPYSGTHTFVIDLISADHELLVVSNFVAASVPEASSTRLALGALPVLLVALLARARKRAVLAEGSPGLRAV